MQTYRLLYCDHFEKESKNHFNFASAVLLQYLTEHLLNNLFIVRFKRGVCKLFLLTAATGKCKHWHNQNQEQLETLVFV